MSTDAERIDAEDGGDDEAESWEPSEMVGYLEDPPSAEERKLLTRRMFPSKVGGKPAWLVPQHLPELVCSKCGRPLRFLLQVYASRGDDNADAFHRVLKLFICTSCQPNEVRAFRVQLPRDNAFYSSEPPDQEQILASAHCDPELEKIICWDCGLPCDAQAGAPACTDDSVEEVVRADAVQNRCEECVRRFRNGDSAALLQERELTCCEADEPEELDDDSGDEAVQIEGSAQGYPRAAVEELPLEHAELALKTASPAQDAGDAAMLAKLEEFKNFVAEDPEHAIDGSEQRAFNEWSKKEGYHDEVFSKFQRFCDANEQHVLRRKFGGEPLWFSTANQLGWGKEPPACPACGAARCFELQVQPQLISLIRPHLSEGGLESDLARRLDYGTVCVYVCKNSCSASADNPYMEEFVHVQPEPAEAPLMK